MKAIVLTLFIFSSIFVYSQYDFPKTSIVNKSTMKIDTLFFGYKPLIESQKHAMEVFRMRRKNFVFYKLGNKIIAPTGKTHDGPKNDLMLQYTKAFWQFHRNIKSRDSIITPVFFSNTKYVTHEDGYDTIIQVQDTSRFKLKTGLIQVIQHNDKCSDTGTNSIIFTNNKGVIYFNYLDNIRFFEDDLNRDGKLELYVFTFKCCEGRLNVFKVE